MALDFRQWITAQPDGVGLAPSKNPLGGVQLLGLFFSLGLGTRAGSAGSDKVRRDTARTGRYHHPFFVVKGYRRWL